MVDPKQDAKKGENYEKWTMEESDTLLELMVDAASRGWRDNSGIFSKTTVEEMILLILNAKLGCNRTYKHYLSRIRWFKTRWSSYCTLMRFSSGFGYDSSTKKFTAPDEVWNEYLKAHPKDADLRYGSFDDYEDLQIAIGNGVAVGKNSIALGNVSDARTFGVDEGIQEDINEHIYGCDYNIDYDAFVGSNDNNLSTHSTLSFRSPEVLEAPNRGTTQNKRKRVECEGNSRSKEGTNDKLDKLCSGVEEMINLLQKRENERQYSLWDAIMEIPNLDDSTRFTVIELLDTKTKKDVFMKMSLQQRANWIFEKLGG